MEAFIDVNNNGIINTHLIYTVDSNGNRTSMTRDTNNDGTFEYSEHYDLNPQGQITKTYVDSTNDGTVDRSITYILDVNGRTVETQTDGNNDGVIDAKTKFVRDANGYVIEEHIDLNNDGGVDNIYYYKRDNYGRIAFRSDDNGANGTINKTYDYSHNTDGTIASQKDTYFDESGNVTEYRGLSYTYDDNARIVTISRTTNDQPISTENRFYDSQNRLIEVDTVSVSGKSEITLYEYNNNQWSHVADKITYIEGTDKTSTPKSIVTYELAGNGVPYVTYQDLFTDGKGVNNIIIHSTAADNTNYDFTTLSQEKLDYFGVNGTVTYIQLINNSAKHSSIVIDHETISKMTNSTLTIRGSESDTVNLQDSSAFTKVAMSDKAGHDQYTYTDLDTGNTQILYIDSDINVVLG